MTEMWYFIAGNFAFPVISFYMYVSSVVGLLPFGGLDQLCTAKAESVSKSSVLFVVVSVVFFIAIFCLALVWRNEKMQYTVKKAINNNILRVIDPTGTELIVTGRGLGFGMKPGQHIDPEKVERSYRMTSPAVQQKLVELLEQIPYEHLLLTDELVEKIKASLRYPLNESLLITLADHISFAIQRSEQGIHFSNPLMGPIREFYPEEYRLGQKCLAEIREKLSVDLSDDEGGFIALHIVNAELNTTMSAVNDITRFVDGCVQVVEYYYGKTFDRSSLDFSRFAVHLRYFAQRVFQGKQEQDSHDEMFLSLIARNCSEHYRCAKCIAEYVEKTWHKVLSDEELVFLTIHLKRINLSK